MELLTATKNLTPLEMHSQVVSKIATKKMNGV